MNKIINDFSITVGTVNGSGSSTANNTILRSIFKMGVPVSGKNLFPSNIQGLPTWYTIRANKDGFIAHHEHRDIVIAMNPASFARDLASVIPAGHFTTLTISSSLSPARISPSTRCPSKRSYATIQSAHRFPRPCRQYGLCWRACANDQPGHGHDPRRVDLPFQRQTKTN